MMWKRRTLLLIFLVLPMGCLPLLDKEVGVSRHNASSSGTLFLNKDLFWKHEGREIEGKVRLNQNLGQAIYLHGKKLHEFLENDENYKKEWCLVVSLTNPLARDHLRMRAVADSFVDVVRNEREYYFRLDIHKQQENTSSCTGTVENVPDSDVAFSIAEVCLTCQVIITSEKISLYESESGINNSRIVPKNKLDLEILNMDIDPKNNILTGVDGCSDNSCSALGFDCCLAGQCVKDGSLKPNASNEADYNRITLEVEEDPLSFIKYPQVYFVCGKRPIQALEEDSLVTSRETLADDIRDFECLKEGKKEIPDFVSTGTCLPGFDEDSYEEIRSTVWRRCGCNADPFPTDPLDQRCPDFGLKAVYDENEPGVIRDIVCDNPDTSFFVEHFQDLEVIIPSRTTPHRFFNSDGESVDDVTTLEKTVKQEGDVFYYGDESNKSNPIISPFGMNAVLGQMSVTLDKAYPAKMIPVLYDQAYIISAHEGLFAPCPNCSDDNWNQLFSAWPDVVDGMGLQSFGYTTNRSLSGDNTTGGNYEDTIFGRACWVPPTMIPFSHKANSDLQQQRLDRLQSQTAFFVNGLRRDWYGFNKGALIGSFDGVKWFAVGQARRVTSTSRKLFLAINSTFSDLTADNVFRVSVLTDIGGNIASDHDYDPRYSFNDPRQNQGGTCQANHFCEKDSDCVGRLGWEYTCVDVKSWRSYWPRFDLDGNEIVNSEVSWGFNNLLQGGLPPGDSKRCVYRGSGAICKRDYTDNLTNEKQELFRCAPNFHCMSIRRNEFNDKVVRTTEEDTFLLFGQEANVLGRPFNYISGSSSIPLAVRENIEKNITLHDEDSPGDWGICRPGKRFTNNILEQHRNKNNEGKTDFISQIAPCDSDTTGDSRVITCPAFVSDKNNSEYGNYVLSSSIELRRRQNSCGKAASIDDGSGNFENVFSQVETGPLSSLVNISEEMVVADACFRKAGAVCHTDLDCSPNRLHEGLTVFLGPENFGGTRAELNYWEEYFICGQGDIIPNVNASNYHDYDLTKNRCCRAVGEDITMYTEVEPTDTDPASHILDFIEENIPLDVSLFTIDDPSADNRYSRYSILGNDLLQGADGTNSNIPYHQEPRVRKDRTPKEFQWKTINDTGSQSCCGGGFVRKFVDGDNNWVKNRLHINEQSFACLNYETELFDSEMDTAFYGLHFNNYENDFGKLCIAPGIPNNASSAEDPRGPQADRFHTRGCVQVPIRLSPNFSIRNPQEIPSTVSIMDTTPLNISGGGFQAPPQDRHMHAPFMPTAYRLNWRTDNRASYNYFHGRRNPNILPPNNMTYVNRTQMAFYLPFYITEDNIATNGVALRYCDDDPDGDGERTCNALVTLTRVTCPSPLVANPTLNIHEYCITNDHTDRRRVFYAVAAGSNPANPASPTNVLIGGSQWARGGIRITYNFPNTDNYIYSDGNLHPEQSGLRAGNALYYLTKLGRLELSGVPQIFYEPLYCNSDRRTLVPGIFDMTNRTEFNSESFDYDVTNANNRALQRLYNSGVDTADASLKETSSATQENRVVFQDKLSLPQVFSGHEFRCCRKLGVITDSASKCCSNYMKQRTTTNSNGESVCVLQTGTNLNVYFNRFISSEGVGEDQPGGGFIDDDFVSETGEVKLQDESYDKLIAMGVQYCENGSLTAGQNESRDPIRRGAILGYYEAEPKGIVPYQTNGPQNSYFSFVDSRWDRQLLGNVPTGRAQYVRGLRWNHHYYCR